jgi:hypothetical protein
MHSKRKLVLVPVLICFAAGAAAGGSAPKTPALKRGQSVMLRKTSGEVDQVVPLPGGEYAVRDSNFRRPETQAIEVYAHSGSLIRKVGGFGNGPQSFLRLMSVAAQADGALWSGDFARRINRYDPSGKLTGTLLLQKPALSSLTSLALDESRGVFYVAGCLPEHVYIDLGCLLVHQYSLKNNEFLHSFVPTDPALLKGNLQPFEATFIDVDGAGNVWAVDAPIFKILRLNPVSGKVTSFPVRSNIARPTLSLPLPKPGEQNQLRAQFDTSFLLWRVLAAGPYAVVSVRKPHDSGYLLQVFDQTGRQVGIDLASPGELAGRTSAGELIFCVPKPPQGFELTEYHVSSAQKGVAPHASGR